MTLLIKPLGTASPTPSTVEPSPPPCVPISTPICDNVGYKNARFPNGLNHKTHDEAAEELGQYIPFILFNCSIDLASLLCAVYMPPCTPSLSSLPPCRSLCERVREGCQPLMHEFDQPWNNELRCETFPKETEGECYQGVLPTLPLITGELQRMRGLSKKLCNYFFSITISL